MDPMNPDHVVRLFKAYVSTEDEWIRLLQSVRWHENKDDMFRLAVQVMAADERIDPDRVLTQLVESRPND